MPDDSWDELADAAGDDLPDPEGSPLPVSTKSGKRFSKVITAGAVLTVVGGTIAILLPAVTCSCHGATTSARMQWEAQQREIEQAADARAEWESEQVEKLQRDISDAGA